MKKKRIFPATKFRRALLLFILVLFVSTLFFYLYKPGRAHAQIFLTSGTSWTVPSDWSSSNNTIEVVGGGGGSGGGFSDASGSGGEGGGGGGGGAYSKVTNVTLSPGSIVTVSIGSAGTAGLGGAPSTNGGVGGDTYLCNSSSNCGSISGTSVLVGAKGGGGGNGGASSVVGAGGAGGSAASSIGSTKFNGGTGGTGGPTNAGAGGGGGGGGGAGGGTTTGSNGITPTGLTHGNGGQGDGTAGGAGATTNSGTGGTGTEWDGSHGSGGGGAGGDGIARGTGSPGGIGGAYGAGAGGGGGNGSKQGNGGDGAAGNSGIIRINYTFTSENAYRWRLDDGNETTGSSLVAQDTAASINYGTNVRLRMTLSNIGSDTTFSYRLEYAPYVGSCGSWTAIPATATTQHFNIFNSANITDQAATTNVSSGPGVITDPSGYTFRAGEFVNNTSNTATNQTIEAGKFTELEYAIQPNSNATYAAYCFRVTTSAGTPLDSYANYPILNINYPPSTPTVYSVTNGTTNAPRLPIFQVKSNDYNYDSLRYVVEVCSANSWPCSAATNLTYSVTDSCWTRQDVSSPGASYAGAPTLAQSAMAYCSIPTSNMLQPNTTYYMRAKAIDPWGSNTYSSYSSVVSFTTNSLEVRILGNTTINGNTLIGN